MTVINKERCIRLGQYIVEYNATIRQTAKAFGMSKSTVHIDVTRRLEEVSPPLAQCVAFVLSENKAQRHIRGGEATKCKYLSLKSNK